MSWPSRITTCALLAVLVGLFSLTNGCGKSGTLDAKTLASYRTALALADEPENILTVADVRAELIGEEPHDHDEHADHDEHDHEEEGHDDHDEATHEEEHAHEEEHNHDDHTPSLAATGPIEVAMVGHVGGLANPWKTTQRDYPFDTTKAVFFLADPLAVIENESHGHNHAPGEECAFCAAYAAEKSHLIAMVRFVDKNGKVLPTDIRQVFDVKEKDTVVVSGTAQVTEGGMMVVNATGLYIRQ